jgi:hypothetical protein
MCLRPQECDYISLENDFCTTKSTQLLHNQDTLVGFMHVGPTMHETHQCILIV